MNDTSERMKADVFTLVSGPSGLETGVKHGKQVKTDEKNYELSQNMNHLCIYLW